VRDRGSDEVLANALVLVSCDCLSAGRETFTDENGVYALRDLPPGDYVLHVSAGSADAFREFTVAVGTRVRVDVVVDTRPRIIT
jgi:hypothetical protein